MSNIFDNIGDTKEAGKKWGMTDENVKKLAQKGEINAKKIGTSWAIDLSQPNPSQHKTKTKLEAKEMWNSFPKMKYDNLILSNFTGGVLSNDHKLQIHYNSDISNYESKDEYMTDTSNQYVVEWDLSDFFKMEEEQKVDWQFPHHYDKQNDKKDRFGNPSQAENTLDYYSSNIFVQYNKAVVSADGVELTIINRPIRHRGFYNNNTIVFEAGAVDKNGNVYKVYWNINKLVSPISIELSLDYTLRCKHCLGYWSRKMGGCVKEEHEFENMEND